MRDVKFPKAVLNQVRIQYLLMNRIQRAEFYDRLQLTRPYFMRVLSGDAPMSQRLALKLVYLGFIDKGDMLEAMRDFVWGKN